MSGANRRDGKLGVLPARFEETAGSCRVAVRFTTGQTLALTFAPKGGSSRNSEACLATQAVAAVSVLSIIRFYS